jgi:hypothetical protein
MLWKLCQPQDITTSRRAAHCLLLVGGYRFVYWTRTWNKAIHLNGCLSSENTSCIHCTVEYMKADVLALLQLNLWTINIQNRPPLWSSGQRSWLQIQRPGFDSRHWQKKKVVGLEWGCGHYKQIQWTWTGIWCHVCSSRPQCEGTTHFIYCTAQQNTSTNHITLAIQQFQSMAQRKTLWCILLGHFLQHRIFQMM